MLVFLGVCLLAVVVVCLWWEDDPIPGAPLPDPEPTAVVRHAYAREEIRALAAEARRLMRVAAVTPIEPTQVSAVVPPRPGAAVARPAVVEGFVWTVRTGASSSTSGGRVTFYMPLRRQS